MENSDGTYGPLHVTDTGRELQPEEQTLDKILRTVYLLLRSGRAGEKAAS